MAGDWIKVKTDLRTHPKVVRISSALKADTLRTLGGLLSVWSLFDTHSHDGQLEGYTADLVDQLIGWPGFASQMQAVGWLQSESDNGLESLVIPRFEVHNGASAKRRAMDSDRKQAVRKMSAQEADKLRTKSGLEKRREEKSTNTPLIPQGGTQPESESGDSNEAGEQTNSSDSKVDKSEATTKKRKGGREPQLTEPVFPESLTAPYRQALTEWFDYKRQRGHGYQLKSWEALVKRESKFTAAQVADSVEASIADNYDGLFTADRVRKTAATGPARQQSAAPAHWQVKQQATEDELATLRFTPARKDPEWPWQLIGQELFDYVWPTAADVPLDNWTAIERYHHNHPTAFTVTA